ncbi:DUF222 domain-containing protein [Streptomyces sp. NPDC000880]
MCAGVPGGSNVLNRYPATLGLLERGDISYQQARIMAETCLVLPTEVAVEVEAAMLPKLPSLAAGQSRRALGRQIVKADPEGAERRHEVRKRQREMVHSPQDDGMALFGAILPAEQAARMTQAVDAHAATYTDMARTLEQKRVDALFDLVVNGRVADARSPRGQGGQREGQRRDQGRAEGGQGRQAAVVQVTVPLDVLIGNEDGPADLKGYGPITASQARKIAFAEGTIWRRLIVAPKTGLLIKTDPATYKPTAETERHVIARDGYCTFPSCRMPAHRCDLDHREPFNHDDPEAGGQTVPENLHPLCRRHHRMKTICPDWVIERDPDTGVITWTSPTGHAYENPPHEYAA